MRPGCVSRAFLEDDFRERAGGEVFAGRIVENGHFVAFANHAREIGKGDVALVDRVVKLAVLVALDDAVHNGSESVKTGVPINL